MNETSNTQSDEFGALLTKYGLKPENFTGVEDLAKELKSSKNKIKAQERESRKMARALREKQQTDENQSINEEFPDDPKMQRLARENREAKRENAEIKKDLWILRNPDYFDLKDIVEELIESDSDVMRVTDPLAQLNMALRLARASAANSDGPTGTPREAGGHHLARGAVSVTRSPAAPSTMTGAGMGSFDEEYDKLLEQFEKELAGAKGDESKQDEIHAKYRKKEQQLRDRFGVRE